MRYDLRWKIMLLSCLFAVGATLGGCATGGLFGAKATAGVEDDEETLGAIDKLQQITIDDLAAARKMATDNGDPAGAACYGALSDRFNRDVHKKPEIKGIFSAYEMLRLGIHKPKDDLNDPVHIACAPLVVDARRTLLRLGVIAGSGGAGGPGLSTLKGAIPLLRQMRGLQ